MFNWAKKSKPITKDITLLFTISEKEEITLSVTWPKYSSVEDKTKVALNLASLIIAFREDLSTNYILDEVAKFAIKQGDEDIYTTTQHYVSAGLNQLVVNPNEVFKGINNATEGE